MSSVKGFAQSAADVSKRKKRKKNAGDDMDYDSARNKVAEDEKAFSASAKRKVSPLCTYTGVRCFIHLLIPFRR